jgi:hypothetical protein
MSREPLHLPLPRHSRQIWEERTNFSSQQPNGSIFRESKNYYLHLLYENCGGFFMLLYIVFFVLFGDGENGATTCCKNGLPPNAG